MLRIPNAGKIPWEAYDFDPIVLGPLYAEDAKENISG